MDLGILEKVRIREVWPGEARDFTPWLASETNLALLGTAIGIDLELDSTEVYVGSYRLDILARDAGGAAVVIENQFGATDHSHLGQLLTYAAGVNSEGKAGAKAVVWIAEDFCEPHRGALDWLNSVSESGVSFFGIQIELWRIGNSLPAPRFTVISKPNGWQRAAVQQTTTTQTDELYLAFWTAFIAFCRQHGTTLRLPNPWGRSWLPTTIGRANFLVSLVVNRRGEVRCELYLSGPKAKRAFQLLASERDVLMQELGRDVCFEELPTRMASRIEMTIMADVTAKEQWTDIHAWLKATGEQFQRAFTGRVRALILDDSEDMAANA